ncbi:hypothetical protein TWF481_011273 [Arthrobotrys musiformis]|uniref:Uncharacterized protein n=1 Tax=Arthrobotrys musiformis TaxID=47236 RepID=A0AAV9W0B0_9PEZI
MSPVLSFPEISIPGVDYLKVLHNAIYGKEFLKLISIPQPQQPDEPSFDWKSTLKNILDQIYKLCSENWALLKFILIVTGGIITIPILLQIAGFGLLGPIAGTFAAVWQASIGNVVAGSFFACLQALGMLPARAVVTGALVGIGVFLWVELKGRFFSAPGKGDDEVPEDGTPPETVKRDGLGRRALGSLRPLHEAYRVGRSML